MTRANSSRRFGRIFPFVGCFPSSKIPVRHFRYDDGDVSFLQWEIGILLYRNFTVRQQNFDVFGDKRHFLQNRLKEYSKIVNTIFSSHTYRDIIICMKINTASRYIQKKRRMSGSREYLFSFHLLCEKRCLPILNTKWVINSVYFWSLNCTICTPIWITR